MAYIAYRFKVEPPQPGSEILIAHLSELGFESFENNPEGFTAYVNADQNFLFEARDYVFEDFKYSFTTEEIQQINWNEEWEKNFEPVRIGDLLCIRASFHPEPKGVKYDIVILPKMSFGTGHHQTTRMICASMCEHDFKNKRVLDMGCGTGVLAILAHQLGARDITGIDVDEWSVENSRENCINNKCPEIKIVNGDAALLKEEAPFDRIMANINKNILKRDLPFYLNRMNEGALLWLSGFFITDVEELLELSAQLGLKHLQTMQEDNWASLLFQKV